MSSLQNSIEQQIESNASKNLLHDSVEQIIEIEPDFLAALEESLSTAPWIEAGRVPSNIVALAAQALVKKLYAVNQYLRVNQTSMEELENIYQGTWQVMLKTHDLESALRESHYPALSRWLASLYPEEFLEPLKEVPLVGHVVCEEYSAQLQMELFKLEVPGLKQPLLDIGCGSHANLVRHLRGLGLEAWGFDRALEAKEPYLEQADWLEMAFEPGRWGTILSNMAFSNHLNYIHRHDVAQLERYLLKMREILASLTVGGKFYYAPGLPFIENRLSARHYKVQRRPVMGETGLSVITRLAG